MTRRSLWYSIRGSLWFVPVMLVLLSIASAIGMVELDVWLDAGNRLALPDTLVAGPDGARQILSVIAGSSITVAGVIFSITIVTLSLAAAQYSPRVLRSFMRDRLNQAVLGILISVFTYNLLVLRAIRSGGESIFVPQLSLWLGILLALVAVGAFIAFIHNTAVSIQAPEIVSRIAGETVSALEAVHEGSAKLSPYADYEFPGREIEGESWQWQAVAAAESGYIQDIDVQELMKKACEDRLVFWLPLGVGDFCIEDQPLMWMAGARADDEKLQRSLQEQVAVSTYRTIEQDPRFGIRQLVDIALKALAPSTNDTTTALHCIDYLGVVLQRALQLGQLPQAHYDEISLRLCVKRPALVAMIDIGFDQIRQNAAGNVAVLARLFELLGQLQQNSSDEGIIRCLREHLEKVSENIDREVASPSDRAYLKQCRAAAMESGD